jgi:hypothetical protein
LSYLGLYQLAGVTSGIHERLAKELGITRAQAVRYVNRAREIGYLSPGQQGRPGAQPGRQMFEEAAGSVAISNLP